MNKQRAFILAIFIFGAISNGFSQSVEQPSGLLLTWQQDPTTTMTIDWHTVPGDDAVSTMFYMKQGDSEWLEMPAEQLAYPFSDRTIHRAELTRLDPDTDYSFRVGEFTRIYSFYTMPAELTRPIRFVVGSDSRHNCELMNNVAMMYDPDFIIWGGDMALADGMEERVDRWYGWFENYRDNLISDEGRVVPFLAGIGNHEMKRQYAGNFYYLFDNYEDTDEWRAFAAPYFIQLFAYPGQPGYNVLDFGDYLSLISLDSDHLNPIEGDQKEWLESVLAERQHIPNVFPVYHTPAYPSHRDFNEPFSQSVRSHWVPLFEQYGIKVAFEAHAYDGIALFTTHVQSQR